MLNGNLVDWFNDSWSQTKVQPITKLFQHRLSSQSYSHSYLSPSPTVEIGD